MKSNKLFENISSHMWKNVFANIAEKIEKREDEKILRIIRGEHITTGFSKKKVKGYFIATESSFLVKKESKSDIHLFSWFNLQKIEQGPDTIILDFGINSDKKAQISEFTSDPEQLTAMINTIIHHIYTILTPSERPAIHIPNFSEPKLTEIEARMKPLQRLRARILSTRDIPFQLNSAFRLWLLNESDTLDMIEMDSDETHTEELFDCLHICDKLRHIIVSGDSSHWREAADFLCETKTVTTFTSRQDGENGFEEFCRTLSEKCSDSVKELCFSRPVDMVSLARIYNRKKLTGLSVHMSGSTEDVTKNIIHFINSLCVDSTKKPYLEKLVLQKFRLPIQFMPAILAACQNMKTLGFKDMGIDLYQFHGMSAKQIRETELLEWDLSGNDMMDRMVSKGRPDRFLLPKKIERLVCNNCRCGERRIVRMLARITVCTGLKCVHINNMNLSLNVTQNVFGKMMDASRYEHSLEELSYDSNYITPEFMCFLERFPHLRVVSLNGCISEPSEVSLLVEYILVNTTVEKLCLNGSMKRRIACESMLDIIDALRRSRTIKHIEIGHQELNPSILDVLGNMLMENRAIEYIDIRDCGISDHKVFTDFLDKLLMRGAPLSIPMPVDDFEELKEDELLVNAIFERLAYLRVGNENVKVPEKVEKLPVMIKPSYRKEHKIDPRMAALLVGSYPDLKVEPEDPSNWELETRMDTCNELDIDADKLLQDILDIDPVPGPEKFGSILD